MKGVLASITLLWVVRARKTQTRTRRPPRVVDLRRANYSLLSIAGTGAAAASNARAAHQIGAIEAPQWARSFFSILMGGVALLLWGLHMVHSGILRAFGPDLRRLLSHALGNRFARLRRRPRPDRAPAKQHRDRR